MVNGVLALESDAWLSDVLHYPVFRVPEGTLPALVTAHAASVERALYYRRIDAAQVEEVATFCQAGFDVIEVNLTFERSPTPETDWGTEISVGPADATSRDDVLAIARSAFRYSRFHLDPAIANPLADEIKRRWVENCLEGGRGDHVFVARHRGQPAGFLAALRSGTTAVVDLIGVAPDAQGRGVGTALMGAFARHYGAVCNRLRVGTQAVNLPSVRLYEKLGYRLVASQFVLHKHARRPATGGPDE